MDLNNKLLQQIFALIWGVAGMYNLIKALSSLLKGSNIKYTRKLMKENTELKKQIEKYKDDSKLGKLE